MEYQEIDFGKIVPTNEGKWNAEKAYPIFSWVTHNGDGWISTKANIGEEPGVDSAVWFQATDVRVLVEAIKKATDDAESLNGEMSDAEKKRAAAEILRDQAEKARAEAERQRTTNETERTTNENQREAAEDKRKADYETNIKLAEQATAGANKAAREALKQATAAQTAAQTADDVTKEFAQEKQKRDQDFSTQMQNQENTFQEKEAERDAAVEAVTNAAGRLNDIERDFGKYAKKPDIALTAETAGKYINANGEYVADANWSVANIGAVVKGNKYELNMGAASNMVLGAALFVSRTYTKNAEGQILRTNLTPLFSAQNTDIPESNYVVFSAFDDYDEVLVCYRPLVTTTLKVVRYGSDASTATQFSNLRREVEQRTMYDGYYGQMRVGMADNLAGTGEGSLQAFHSRQTGGGNIMDGDAQIQSIQGQTIKFNQLFDDINPTLSYLTRVKENDYWVVTNKNEITTRGGAIRTNADLEEGHIYLFQAFLYCDIENANVYVGQSNTWGSGRSAFSKKYTKTGEWEKVSFITQKYIIPTSYANKFCVYCLGVETFKYKNPLCIDLTAIFGEGNEPSTPEAFEAWLDEHFGQHEYFDYNEGSLVSFNGTAIKSEGTEDVPFTSTRNFGDVLQKYFPDGMKRIGDVYDEITPTHVIRRIGAVDLGTLTPALTNWRGNSTGVGWLYARNVIAAKFPKKDSELGAAITAKYNTTTYLESYNRGFGLSLCPSSQSSYSIAIFQSDTSLTSLSKIKSAMQGIILYYELAEPIITEFEQPLNLTYKVAEGGTETLLQSEGEMTTEFNGIINYQKDYVKVIDTLQEQNQVTEIDIPSWEL